MDTQLNIKSEENKGPRFGKLSEHFHSDEFRCMEGKCPYCEAEAKEKGVAPTYLHKDGVPSDLIDLLEEIRARFGDNPITINSGYRCVKHNRDIGGEPFSYHTKGLAADIRVDDTPPSDVQELAEKINPQGGVGRYKTFTHVDVRGYKARWNG